MITFRLNDMKIIKVILMWVQKKPQIDLLVSGGNELAVKLDKEDLKLIISEFGNKK